MQVEFSELRWVDKPLNATTETSVVYGNPYVRIHRDSAGLFIHKRGKGCLLTVTHKGKAIA